MTTKKRTARAVSAPSDKDLDNFINGAQVNKLDPNPFDPNESRTRKIDGKVKPYKTIGMQFNRYEWWELEQAEKITKRSKNSIIREGIELAIEEAKKS